MQHGEWGEIPSPKTQAQKNYRKTYNYLYYLLDPGAGMLKGIGKVARNDVSHFGKLLSLLFYVIISGTLPFHLSPSLNPLLVVRKANILAFSATSFSF